MAVPSRFWVLEVVDEEIHSPEIDYIGDYRLAYCDELLLSAAHAAGQPVPDDEPFERGDGGSDDALLWA